MRRSISMYKSKTHQIDAMKSFFAGLFILAILGTGITVLWEVVSFIVWLFISFPVEMLLGTGAFVLVYFAQRWRVE